MHEICMGRQMREGEPDDDVVDQHATCDDGHEVLVGEDNTLALFHVRERNPAELIGDACARRLLAVALHMHTLLEPLLSGEAAGRKH